MSLWLTFQRPPLVTLLRISRRDTEWAPGRWTPGIYRRRNVIEGLSKAAVGDTSRRSRGEGSWPI
jgi:hypothetical protein